MAQASTRSTQAQGSKSAQKANVSATPDLDDLKDEASESLADVSEKAKQVAAEAGDRVGTMFEAQKRMGAQYISRLAGVAEMAASQLDEEAPDTAQYLRRAVGQVRDFSDKLGSRSAGELIQDVQELARKNPAAFLGATALLGFAVSRFLKTSKPSTTPGPGSRRAGTNQTVGPRRDGKASAKA